MVDSRLADDGTAIRRRRECATCGRRFTTFERIKKTTLMVVKRSGNRKPFDRSKMVADVRTASKNRPVSSEDMETLAGEVEEAIRLLGPEPSSQQIGVVVLDRLRRLDEVAYLRFASVYKGFEDVGDFEREVGLLSKATEPKRRV